jgi:hypothetical protein
MRGDSGEAGRGGGQNSSRPRPLWILICQHQIPVTAIPQPWGVGPVKMIRRALESSLIGVIEVKLLLIARGRVGIAPVGHSLLFAVGCPSPVIA